MPRGQHLPEVIVELAGNRAALRLLRLDQLARQRLQLLRSSPQLLLGVLVLGDVGIGSVRAHRPPALVVNDRGAAEDPVHCAVGPDDAVLDLLRSCTVLQLFAAAHDPAAVVGMDGLDVVLHPRAFAPVVAEEEAPIRFRV